MLCTKRWVHDLESLQCNLSGRGRTGRAGVRPFVRAAILAGTFVGMTARARLAQAGPTDPIYGCVTVFNNTPCPIPVSSASPSSGWSSADPDCLTTNPDGSPGTSLPAGQTVTFASVSPGQFFQGTGGSVDFHIWASAQSGALSDPEGTANINWSVPWSYFNGLGGSASNGGTPPSSPTFFTFSQGPATCSGGGAPSQDCTFSYEIDLASPPSFSECMDLPDGAPALSLNLPSSTLSVTTSGQACTANVAITPTATSAGGYPVTLAYTLDGASAGSGARFSQPLAVGNHTLVVTATDLPGFQTSATESIVIVDGTTPTLTPVSASVTIHGCSNSASAIPVAVPVASDICGGTAPTVTATVTQYNGASTSVPVVSGTANIPPGSGTIQFTATNPTGGKKKRIKRTEKKRQKKEEGEHYRA